VESDKVEHQCDRLALGAMIRGVPPEMQSTLLNEKSAKEAWEAIKSMHLDADRVKEVNTRKLLAEFEWILFKSGEMIEDFAVRIRKLSTDLKGLGEMSADDACIMKKFLRVVPPKYNQVTVTIEMFYDLKTLTIEELVERLQVAEYRFEPIVEEVTNKAGQLMLCEEEWATKSKSPAGMESSSLGGKGGGNGHCQKKNKSRACGGSGGGRESRDSGSKESTGTPCHMGWCNKCKVYDHWARECKKGAKEALEVAHHTNADTDVKPALLVAQVYNLVRTASPRAPCVFLNQDLVIPS